MFRTSQCSPTEVYILSVLANISEMPSIMLLFDTYKLLGTYRTCKPQQHQ